MTYNKIVKKTLESVLLDPRVPDSLKLARENIKIVLKKYEAIDVYTEVLKETIEDLDKIIFLIEQMKLEFYK